MNDFSELEAELKQLRPAPIGDELFRRIERALLAQPEATPTAGILPRPPSRTGVWWSLGLGLAAASVLVLLGLGFFAPPPHSARLSPKKPRPQAPP